MDSVAVMRDRGVLTLPKEVRERNDFQPGTRFQVIDLGQGTIVLTRQASILGELAEEISKAMDEAGVSLEDLLQAAREERERLYQQRYG
ncbi:MAG: AbrB/MazE/SpoVT family DNA-binding domain-containing protein [Anaerolineae bacterium]|nr:AbrB/MazE/SpoVT family DNA-binding domain-containing protein [Anaerolineae bacterium]